MRLIVLLFFLAAAGGGGLVLFRFIPKHPLWKAKGKHNTVYLLGSVHTLRDKDYPLAEPIETAFANVPAVAFEVDLEEITYPRFKNRVLQAARCPPNETLRTQLSAHTYSRLTEYLLKGDLPVAAFGEVRPSFVAQALDGMAAAKLGFDEESGVDKHFFRLARKQRKEIVALETAESQIRLFTDMSKDEADALLKVTLRDLSMFAEKMEELLSAWRRGDANKLESLIKLEEAPAVQKRIFGDRNRRWLPAIEDLLKRDQDAMVIVGSGHLVGPDSVVTLLKKKGYRVTQQW